MNFRLHLKSWFILHAVGCSQGSSAVCWSHVIVTALLLVWTQSVVKGHSVNLFVVLSRPTCRDGYLLVISGSKTPDISSERRTYVDVMTDQKLKATKVSLTASRICNGAGWHSLKKVMTVQEGS